jgi:hypothetical protein
MIFMIYCIDKENSQELRQANRDDHLAYIREHLQDVYCAGPVLGEDGQTPVGSLLMMDFPTRAYAEAFAEADPYNRAGVFERVEIKPWKEVFP